MSQFGPITDTSVFMRPELLLAEKSGVNDRHDRALRPGQSFNFGVEVLRECFDDAGSEPGFWLGKDTVRLANSIISNREFPIRAIDIERDADPALHIFAGKCMLESIHDEFGRDQANTLGLTGLKLPAAPTTFSVTGRTSPIIDVARASPILRDKEPFQ